MDKSTEQEYQNSIAFLESVLQVKESKIQELSTVQAANQIILNAKVTKYANELNEASESIFALKVKNRMLIDESEKLIEINERLLDLANRSASYSKECETKIRELENVKID